MPDRRGYTCVGKSKRNPTVWVQDLTSSVASVSTGDLVLFSSKHSGAKITKFFTNSEWDHVGIIVKPSASRTYIVEWGGGLFASELVERLTEYYTEDGRTIMLRRLVLESKARAKLEDKLEAFVDHLFRNKLGSNEMIPMGQVVRAARKQWISFSSSAAVVDDLTQLFCSKTVAVCYKQIGILGANRDASDFLPKHFAGEYDPFLALRRARLGEPLTITFEPKLVRGTVVSLFALTGNSRRARREERAAQTIQNAARRFRARRELRARMRGVVQLRMQAASVWRCGILVIGDTLVMATY